jgi:transporter family-2 protein
MVTGTIAEKAAGGSSSRKPVGGLLVVLFAFLLGGAIAIQAQLNGALTERSGSAVLVTLVSFTIGTVILTVIVTVRREWPSRERMRSWSWRRWWFFNGPLGAFLIVAIATEVPVLGVALVTVLTVAGQTVTGIVLDSRGAGAGAPLRISGRRSAAALVAIAGLAVTVFAVPIGSDTTVFALIVMIVVLIAAGVASSLQQAANGGIAGVSSSATFAALTSFASGLVVLLITAVVLAVSGTTKGVTWPISTTDWWLYSGGLFGTLFVIGTAWAVRKIGVLALSLAVVAGQIVGAVILDLASGSPSIGVATIVSLVAVFVAVVLAVAPRQPSRAAPLSEGNDHE